MKKKIHNSEKEKTLCFSSLRVCPVRFCDLSVEGLSCVTVLY